MKEMDRKSQLNEIYSAVKVTLATSCLANCNKISEKGENIMTSFNAFIASCNPEIEIERDSKIKDSFMLEQQPLSSTNVKSFVIAHTSR